MTTSGRIFLFEYLTGGGLFRDDLLPDQWPSLVVEGSTMRDAVLEDITRTGRSVTIMCDERLPGPNSTTVTTASGPSIRTLSVSGKDVFDNVFERALANCDEAWIIAPELGGAHLELTERAEAQVPLVSPGRDVVRLASDKQSTADFLRGRGIRTPQGEVSSSRLAPRGQLVRKPNDGVGSLDIRLVGEHERHLIEELVDLNRKVRIEEFIEGPAFSVSVLGSPTGFLVLEPCDQKISDDGNFRYLGGQLPVSSASTRRELCKTAALVAQSLPRWHGYLGLDMVVGSEGAYVIEINPRLTTSYVGLRKWYDQNLTQIVLDSAHGPIESLSARKFQLQFDPYGRVEEVRQSQRRDLVKYHWQDWQ